MTLSKAFGEMVDWCDKYSVNRKIIAEAFSAPNRQEQGLELVEHSLH